jgi:hypothetical protein
MTQNRSLGKLFAYGLILALLLFSLIRTLLSTGGMLFNLELIILVIFLALTVGGLVGYKTWGEGVLFGVFVLYLVNLLGLWLLLGSIGIVPLVLTVVGFVLAIPERKNGKVTVENKPEELHSMVFEPAKEAAPIKEEPKTKFTPGKLVASKFGNTYHAPKCEWANNIKKANRIWFVSKEEAEKKQYKAHDCIK